MRFRESMGRVQYHTVMTKEVYCLDHPSREPAAKGGLVNIFQLPYLWVHISIQPGGYAHPGFLPANDRGWFRYKGMSHSCPKQMPLMGNFAPGIFIAWLRLHWSLRFFLPSPPAFLLSSQVSDLHGDLEALPTYSVLFLLYCFWLFT